MFKESNILRLRFTQLNDLDFVCNLEADEENSPFIIPWDFEKHKKALENKDILHLIIEEKESNHSVGYMIIAGRLNPNLSIEIVRITICDKGKGFGKEAFKLIKEWAFITHHANRLWLDVKVNNLRAFNLYKKQGFTVEGTLRECIKNGNNYDSLYVMSMLKSEYDMQKKTSSFTI